MPSVRSAYIHVPFCRRRCYYCDFPVSVVGDKPLAAVERESMAAIRGRSPNTFKYSVKKFASLPGWVSRCKRFSLGGTPSLLAVEQLNQILTALDQQFGIAANAEISMEIDPATFDLVQIKGYKAAGINRVSLGVQAFQPELLKVAGRSHTVADILTAVDLTYQAGFTNLSLDLISGLPHQTLEQWEESLEQAVACSPTHLSCYDLIVEAGTPFSRQYKPGNKPLPSDETTAEMYRTAQRLLTANGFEHYEISNYTKPGYQCQHNRVYWENRPFYGFGMGATSYLNGERFARPRKTWEYYEWVEQEGEGRRNGEDVGGARSQESGIRSQKGESEPCKPDLLDTLMLGLRLAEGLDIAWLIEQFGQEAIARLWKCLQPYLQDGLVAISPTPDEHQLPTFGSVRLTDPEGFLLSNVVLTTIFEKFE